MSAWLLSIVGVAVIGVVVELVLTDSPMAKFIRSIYSFFILFVIIAPLPALLKSTVTVIEQPSVINTDFVNNLTARRVTQMLSAAGYNCTVSVHGDKIAVNAKNSTKKNTAEIISIVTAVAQIPPEKVEVII